MVESEGKVLDEADDLDLLENWDDLPVSRKGYLGGKTLRRKEIQFWMNEIERISEGKSRLIVLPKGHKMLQGNVAGFNAFDGNLYVQKGLTEYEIFHEFKHFEEFTKLGKEKYLFGHKNLGYSLEQNLTRTYKREKYVFDEIMKNKSRFNQEQLNHAQKYIDRKLQDLLDNNIDINKI